MTVIIPSSISSELESQLRSHDPCECNLADYYYFVTVDENNIVDNTIVASFEVAEKRTLKYNRDYILNLSLCTYLREDHPGMVSGYGDTWDPVNQVFYEEQPHDSWTLNTTTWKWEAPLPYPTDGLNYVWNEEAYQADNTTGWEYPYLLTLDQADPP